MEPLITSSLTAEIISLLRKGNIGVLPTDTLYGVVGLLSSRGTVERIYKVKHRNPLKPVGTILIANRQQIETFTDEQLLKMATDYWPGPTSVILPLSDELSYAHKGLKSLPFRIPADETLRQFLEETGPLATSSANLEGRPPATSLEEAKNYFGDQVNFYVDGGDLSHRQASRIISIDESGRAKEVRS